MSSTNFNGVLHVLAQLLAQGVILALVPTNFQPYLQALAVIIGIVLSYTDPTATIEKLGMSKPEYLGKVAEVKLGQNRHD